MPGKANGGIVSGGQIGTFVDPYATCPQYPVAASRDAEIAAAAIRQVARAMPTYKRRGEPSKFDGEDVVEFLLEYADTLVQPATSRRRIPARWEGDDN